jgi:diguanylate cyclase (GGDEF)-like protein
LFVKANFDALTGIHNRRYLEHGIKQIISYIGRSDASLSVIMMDVDNFKKYNDTYGHDEGDKCLKAVAGAINESVTREHDFAARYGGEEFIIVLPNTDEAGARLIAEKALENVRKLEIPHSANTAAPYVTISAGVTTAKVTHDRPWEEYVKRADEALYTAKQSGRNQYVYLEF